MGSNTDKNSSHAKKSLQTTQASDQIKSLIIKRERSESKLSSSESRKNTEKRSNEFAEERRDSRLHFKQKQFSSHSKLNKTSKTREISNNAISSSYRSMSKSSLNRSQQSSSIKHSSHSKDRKDRKNEHEKSRKNTQHATSTLQSSFGQLLARATERSSDSSHQKHLKSKEKQTQENVKTNKNLSASDIEPSYRRHTISSLNKSPIKTEHDHFQFLPPQPEKPNRDKSPSKRQLSQDYHQISNKKPKLSHTYPKQKNSISNTVEHKNSIFQPEEYKQDEKPIKEQKDQGLISSPVLQETILEKSNNVPESLPKDSGRIGGLFIDETEEYNSNTIDKSEDSLKINGEENVQNETPRNIDNQQSPLSISHFPTTPPNLESKHKDDIVLDETNSMDEDDFSYPHVFIKLPKYNYTSSYNMPFNGLIRDWNADTSQTFPTLKDLKNFQKSLNDPKSKFLDDVKVTANQGFNIKKICFGRIEMEPWYPSPYPREYIIHKSLYICPYCLKYMSSKYSFQRHNMKCGFIVEDGYYPSTSNGLPKVTPPGNEIYRRGPHSIYEVDGATESLYCTNLCLLAKLYINSKAKFSTVFPFTFYVLVERQTYKNPQNNFQIREDLILGFFSKEKRHLSKQDDLTYNLSCLLVLPYAQKSGYGSLLIEFSYLLSRLDKCPGTPEKPLSKHGVISYQKYWKLAVCYALREIFIFNQQNYNDEQKRKPPQPQQSTNCMPLSVKNISKLTGMIPADVVYGLEALKFLVFDEKSGKYALKIELDIIFETIEKFESKYGVGLLCSSLSELTNTTEQTLPLSNTIPSRIEITVNEAGEVISKTDYSFRRVDQNLLVWCSTNITNHDGEEDLELNILRKTPPSDYNNSSEAESTPDRSQIGSANYHADTELDKETELGAEEINGTIPEVQRVQSLRGGGRGRTGRGRKPRGRGRGRPRRSGSVPL